jgi:hypothetical protein
VTLRVGPVQNLVPPGVLRVVGVGETLLFACDDASAIARDYIELRMRFTCVDIRDGHSALSHRNLPATICPSGTLLRDGVGQKLKGGSRKGKHVGEPLGTAGLKCNGPFDRAGDGKTSVARRIAVAISSRSSRAGFAQAPRCGEACPRTARK